MNTNNVALLYVFVSSASTSHAALVVDMRFEAFSEFDI